MKIFDLTRGKYPTLFSSGDSDYFTLDYADVSGFHKGGFPRLFSKNEIDPGTLWRTIPFFLVESSMADEYVAVPECQCLIRVPEDKWWEPADGAAFNIDEWVNMKEKEGEEDPRERRTSSLTIHDLLGVYVYSRDEDMIPRRIFVWMDKIWEYAKDNSGYKSDVTPNAQALFELILYHEMAHALMDTELYGVHPSPCFSYARDYPYRYLEEACANAFALTMLLDEKRHPYSSMSFNQKAFIESFVKHQGDGYSEGWTIFQEVSKPRRSLNLDQWLGLKVLFNYEFALLLKSDWGTNRILDIVVVRRGLVIDECPSHHNNVFYEDVGRKGWISVTDHRGKWGILELPGQTFVKGFRKYHSFYCFDENGLCRVILNRRSSGLLYGYVNELGKEQIPVEYEDLSSFENGLAIAKKNGLFGAIDLNNQTVIPFNLSDEKDVREQLGRDR